MSRYDQGWELAFRELGIERWELIRSLLLPDLHRTLPGLCDLDPVTGM